MMQMLTAQRWRVTAILLVSLFFNAQGRAQSPPDPVREQLLNGLKILIWTRPGSQDLTLKLRIHSGAAFDLAGKAGGMCLLGDLLFPDPATIEFFTDEMAGKLDVETDLDSITVTMLGRANEFERIIEILRNALVTMQITPELVARQRDRRLKIVKDMAVLPASVADRAVAARLFGEHPYGRPLCGSAEDLARVEVTDLKLAKERFLNSNNATLALVGGVEKARAMKALRQLLGSWRKSEQIVPSTFRHANAPDSKTLIINGPADQSADLRLAVRGVARSDPDYFAANALALVARQRWLKLSPELSAKPFFVRNEAHVLPGIFVMGAALDGKSVATVMASAKKVLASLVDSPATPSEFAEATNELIASANNRQVKPETMLDAWVELDTFQLRPVSEQLQTLRQLSAADLQRTAARLFRGTPVASVVLGDSQQLKATLEGQVSIEVMGEITKPVATSPETKPAPKSNTVEKP